MAPTKKQVHKTKAEVKDEMNLGEERAQADDKACADEIQVVLEKYNRALQPFLVNTENGNFPRVRLVRVPAKADAEVEAA